MLSQPLPKGHDHEREDQTKSRPFQDQLTELDGRLKIENADEDEAQGRRLRSQPQLAIAGTAAGNLGAHIVRSFLFRLPEGTFVGHKPSPTIGSSDDSALVPDQAVHPAIGPPGPHDLRTRILIEDPSSESAKFPNPSRRLLDLLFDC